ncbi:MAG: LytR C-terminal domain-containing protein [Nocardioides sp.]
MEQAARSGLTLAGLAVLVILGGLWGWSAMTQPFPGKTTPPKCVATVVQPGEKVFPGQVTVSVFNASERNGLAGRTMAEFVNAGFAEGDTGNAPRDARVVRASIWAPTAASPDVRLVASRLGPATRVVRRDAPGVGVTVVVGDRYQQLVKGPRSIQASREAEICSPPVA